MNNSIQQTSETKKCRICGEHLPLENFNKKVKSKDGLQSYCKKCQSLVAKERTERLKGTVGQRNMLKVYSNPELAKFKPRELIAELKARGYSRELTYTQRIAL